MSSFINLEQRFHSEDPDRIIKITQERINSLALIHERIYNEDNMDYISVAEFFENFDRNIYVFSLILMILMFNFFTCFYLRN